MTPDEVRALLAETAWVAIGSLDPDGTPRPDVAACALEGDRLCFALPRGSASDRNLRRDPRACAATDRYPTYAQIRGATLHGLARELDGAGPAGLPEGAVWWLPLDDVVSFDFSRIPR